MDPISKSYNIDCVLGMKDYPDKFFDLAIVDPQTGQGEGKNHLRRLKKVRQTNGDFIKIKTHHRVKEWDESPPTQEYYDELFRVSKHQIILCENYLFFEQKKESAGRIIWNLLRENNFSACQIMWTSLFQKIEYFEYLWNGMIQGVSINSRVQYGNKKLNQKRIHPSEKPVHVYRHLIRLYMGNSGKLLDTHLGSGSIRMAAFLEGVDFVGMEIDQDIFSDQEERFGSFIKEVEVRDKVFTPDYAQNGLF